jgi:hypothetical protein
MYHILANDGLIVSLTLLEEDGSHDAGLAEFYRAAALRQEIVLVIQIPAKVHNPGRCSTERFIQAHFI